MKFAHLADSHLGYRQYGLLERENDFYDVFDTIVDKILEEEVDFVIHSGDLFEVAKPSPKALLRFQNSFLKLTEANIPVYAIAGNHDSVMRKNSVPPQVLFKELGLKVISPKTPAYVQNDVFIGGTPYLSKSQKSLLLAKYQALAKEAKKYSKSILVSHQGIDKYLPFQYEIEIGDLPTNFDYYAMGHIHNYINDEFGKGRLVYPGSTDIWKSNEAGDALKNGKGFCVVDLDTDDVPLVKRVSVDLPREFITENIEYNKLSETLQKIKNHIISLDNKPILNLTVEKGNFTSSDVYDTINKNLGKYALMIRPSFKPDKMIAEEQNIINDDNLEPRQLLIDSLEKEYKNNNVNDLAIELLDNLSKDKLEESEKIANSYYDNHYELSKEVEL